MGIVIKLHAPSITNTREQADDNMIENTNAHQSAAGHSYLNTIERAMSNINIGLANYATCLDPDSPQFLLDKSEEE